MKLNNMQQTLTTVVRKTTDKEGNPLKTKDNRPYTRLSIKTQEHGDTWVSGFDGPITKNWKVGDLVDIEIEQKGEYFNFRVPKPEDKVDEKLEMILNRITGIGLRVEVIADYLAGKKDETYPKQSNKTAFDAGEVDEMPDF